MFDVFTLLLVLALTHFLSTAVLAVVWRVNKSIPGIREWAIGRFVGAVGFAVLGLRVWIDPPAIIVFGNVLVAVSVYIVLIGHRRFAGRSAYPHWPFAWTFLVYLGVFIYFSFVTTNFPIRTMASSALYVVYALLSAHALWPKDTRSDGVSRMLVACLFVFHAAFNTLRFGLSFTDPASSQILETSALSIATLIEGIAVSLVSAMGYVTMTTERLQIGLKQQAQVDPLTGAYNRRAFYAQSEKVLSRRVKKQGALSLILLDIDHFKSINDGHGHAVGDRVLRQLVDCVRGLLRGSDIFSRFGGEEFVILLPTTNLQEAMTIAERIRLAVEKTRFDLGDTEGCVTISLGVSSIGKTQASDAINGLIDEADKALYRAKHSGRNVVAPYAAVNP